MLMKRIILILIVLFILGCDKTIEMPVAEEASEVVPVLEEATELPPEEIADTPPVPDCTQCTVKEVTVTTSDGDTLPLVPGKGGYTGAGAIEWVVEKAPAQCEEELTVPIKIVKRSYGKIVGEDTVSLRDEETSKIIDHPTIKTLKFTLRVDDLKLKCP
jgi:hypothetical protein